MDLAHSLWTTINQRNQSLANTLLHLSELYSQDPTSYVRAVKYISSLQPVQVSQEHIVNF